MLKASVSKINCINRCKKKYYYSYVRELEKLVVDTRLSKGVLIHSSLENYYSNKDWTKPLEEYQRYVEKNFDGEEYKEQLELVTECYRIMRSYLINYGDEKLEVLAVELPFEVEIKGFMYTGIIDLIYKDSQGDVWVCDHKTVKAIPDEGDASLSLQTTLYFGVAHKLGYNPTGIEFNYIRTKSPTKPKLLKNGTLSKAKNIDTDVATYSEAIRNAGLNPDDYADMLDSVKHNVFFKRLKLPKPTNLLKSAVEEFENSCITIRDTKVFPRTMNMNCNWDCPYQELCHAELRGTDVEYIEKSLYKLKEKR
jgi:hypothetical protein